MRMGVDCIAWVAVVWSGRDQPPPLGWHGCMREPGGADGQAGRPSTVDHERSENRVLSVGENGAGGAQRSGRRRGQLAQCMFVRVGLVARSASVTGAAARVGCFGRSRQTEQAARYAAVYGVVPQHWRGALARKAVRRRRLLHGRLLRLLLPLRLLCLLLQRLRLHRSVPVARLRPLGGLLQPSFLAAPLPAQRASRDKTEHDSATRVIRQCRGISKQLSKARAGREYICVNKAPYCNACSLTAPGAAAAT